MIQTLRGLSTRTSSASRTSTSTSSPSRPRGEWRRTRTTSSTIRTADSPSSNSSAGRRPHPRGRDGTGLRSRRPGAAPDRTPDLGEHRLRHRVEPRRLRRGGASSDRRRTGRDHAARPSRGDGRHRCASGDREVRHERRRHPPGRGTDRPRSRSRPEPRPGCPVLTHTTRGTMAHEQLDLLEARERRPVEGRAQPHGPDSSTSGSCASSASAAPPSSSTAPRSSSTRPTKQRIEMLRRLVEAGHAERLLVSGRHGTPLVPPCLRRRARLRAHPGTLRPAPSWRGVRRRPDRADLRSEPGSLALLLTARGERAGKNRRAARRGSRRRRRGHGRPRRRRDRARSPRERGPTPARADARSSSIADPFPGGERSAPAGVVRILHEHEREPENVGLDLRPEPARRASPDDPDLARLRLRVDAARRLEVAGVLVGDALEQRPVKVLPAVTPRQADEGAGNRGLVRADPPAEVRDANELLGSPPERSRRARSSSA